LQAAALCDAVRKDRRATRQTKIERSIRKPIPGCDLRLLSGFGTPVAW
jgi:hypothetical protein